VKSRLARILLTAGALTGIAPGLHAAGSRYELDLEPPLRQFIERQQIPGLAIAIVQDDRIVYENGFGWLSLDKSKGPVTPFTVFHMASIVKPFVASAILQLAAQNKVDLDAPVVHYLPYFRLADRRYAAITVRQMVEHTSGVPDVTDYQWDKPQYDDAALERYVRGLSDMPLLFAPGERFAYSNTAYDILGDVIAKASGESFEGYVQHHILSPLGMTNSTLLYTDIDPKLLSDGHVLDSNGNPAISPAYPYNRIHSPSSNLHSNAVDMMRWAIANMNHGELDGVRILPAAAYASMWKPAQAVGAPAIGTHVTAEGISWYLGSYRGNFLVTHSGGDLGFITDLAMLPAQKIAVVWMANCDWIDAGPINGPITFAALDVALGLKPKPITLRRSLTRTLYFTYQQHGIEAAVREYRLLKDEHGDLYDFGSEQLSELGATLRAENHLRDAIRILQLNVAAHPASPHGYEELARAYEADGNKPLAITNFEKAAHLNATRPQPAHAPERAKQQSPPD